MSHQQVVQDRLQTLERNSKLLNSGVGSLDRSISDAAGRQQSLIYETNSRLDGVNLQLGAMLSMQATYLPQILDTLTDSSESLQRIEQLLATPRATAARELRDEAARLASRNLLDEAETEINKAIESYMGRSQSRRDWRRVCTRLRAGAQASGWMTLVRRPVNRVQIRAREKQAGRGRRERRYDDIAARPRTTHGAALQPPGLCRIPRTVH